MNNDIKEILDKLKDDCWYDELDLTGDKWIELKQTETKQILDYITNLQENDDLKNRLENAVADCNLRLQENERLNENNQAMQEEMARTWKIADDYKLRIYKARKMIFDNYGVLDKYEIELLDDILKGDANE